MFKRVLVATDFSAHADHTLECIGEIPGMEEILLVHVIPGLHADEKSFFSPAHRSVREQAQVTLEEKRTVLERMTGVPVSPRIAEAVDGDIAGAIVGLAQRENIPLIVMGGRGKGLLYGYILGSVSGKVIERSRTDVLIMHFRGSDNPDEKTLEKFCRNMFFHVLCPVDFSRPSLKTVAYAKSLGCINRITLLHVTGEDLPDTDKIRHEEKNRQQLEEITADLAAGGISTASEIRTGPPAELIVRVARELDVSLIMIARVGQSDYSKNIPLGRVAAGVAASAERPLFMVNPHISLNVMVKELDPTEFDRAEQLWSEYHGQKADRSTDRIFGVFVEGAPAAVARCRRHPDGLEADGVFVPEWYRGRGYARMAVRALVDACGSEPLFMHATLDLVHFYETFGFILIGEHELPRSIMERFSFADGDLEGANVTPMKRLPQPDRPGPDSG